MSSFLNRAILAASLTAASAFPLASWAQTTADSATTEAPAADTAADPAATDAGEAMSPVITEMIQGNPDSTVEVIEYASFTCPHCAAFHANQYQELLQNYIEPGKIRFVYREIYFDRFGLWASMVARCGGEMRFFGIADMLYDQQQEWLAGGQDPALIGQNLRQIGIVAGMDGATVDACLADGPTAEALVGWFEENSSRDGVQSTPSFIINGQLYSNMSYEDFAAILDEKLAE